MQYSINNLELKSLYEKYKDEYLERRGSTDTGVWDESYKWEILPALQSELAKYDTITRQNTPGILEIYLKHNPQQGTLIDWREADDLRTLVSKPNGWQLLRDLWQASPENVAEIIDENNEAMGILGMPGKKFSPRTYGYLLAGKNPKKFSPFLQSIYDFLKEELSATDEWRSATLGEKYQIFTETVNSLGEIMKPNIMEQTVNGTKINNHFPALNGQDFLYVMSLVKEGGYEDTTRVDVSDGSKSLSDLLLKVTTQYSDETSKSFGRSDFTDLVTIELPGILETHYNHENFIIKGSVGTGNWAETPWVAIMDPRITTSTQEGYYICYLIDPKQKIFYLCLAVGWTQFESKFDSTQAKERIFQYSEYLTSYLKSIPTGFRTGKIDLSAEKSLTKGYEYGQILSKRYSTENLEAWDLIGDLDSLIRSYKELADVVGSDILNINYEQVSTNQKLGSIDKKLNKISLSNNLDDIKKMLEGLITNEPPAKQVSIVKKAIRNPKIARLYKQSKNYVCELCGREPFIQKNGEPYAEADHVKPLGSKGYDSPDNMRCLCAQCHAVITHGSYEEISKLQQNDSK